MKLLGGFAVALILLISPSPAHESWIAARSAIPLRALAGLDHGEKPGCAGGDKDSGMVRRPLDPVAARIALEECRRQAQKCIDESAKAETPTLRASWLALAEQWVRMAERVSARRR